LRILRHSRCRHDLWLSQWQRLANSVCRCNASSDVVRHSDLEARSSIAVAKSGQPAMPAGRPCDNRSPRQPGKFQENCGQTATSAGNTELILAGNIRMAGEMPRSRNLAQIYSHDIHTIWKSV